LSASAVGDGRLQTGRRRGSRSDAGGVCGSVELLAVAVDIAGEEYHVGIATEVFTQVRAVCTSAGGVRRLETCARQI
jgi:hypothetical protein